MTQAQLIDTWRSLFTERTSSPAIERFLGMLSGRQHDAQHRHPGEIRITRRLERPDDVAGDIGERSRALGRGSSVCGHDGVCGDHATERR